MWSRRRGVVGAKKNASLKGSFFFVIAYRIGILGVDVNQDTCMIFSHFSTLLLPKCFASGALSRTPRGLTAPPQLGNVTSHPWRGPHIIAGPNGPEPPRSATAYEAKCCEVFEPDIVSFNMYSVLCDALCKLTLTFV